MSSSWGSYPTPRTEVHVVQSTAPPAVLVHRLLTLHLLRHVLLTSASPKLSESRLKVKVSVHSGGGNGLDDCRGVRRSGTGLAQQQQQQHQQGYEGESLHGCYRRGS